MASTVQLNLRETFGGRAIFLVGGLLSLVLAVRSYDGDLAVVTLGAVVGASLATYGAVTARRRSRSVQMGSVWLIVLLVAAVVNVLAANAGRWEAGLLAGVAASLLIAVIAFPPSSFKKWSEIRRRPRSGPPAT